MAIAPSDAISHGAISNVAKLRLASTNLPLLTVGVVRCPGAGVTAGAVLGCMRDMFFDGGAMVLIFVVDDDCEENRRRLRNISRLSSAEEHLLEYEESSESEDAVFEVSVWLAMGV